MKNLKEYSLCIENVCQRVGEKKLTSKPSFVDFLRIYFNGVDYCTSASETKCFQISDKEGWVGVSETESTTIYIHNRKVSKSPLKLNS